MEAHVDWTSPAALWHQYRGPADERQRQVFLTPAILKFSSDTYMQELLDLMQTNPHHIAGRLAAPETWSKRETAPAPIVPKRGLIGKLERARAAVVQRLEAQQLALVRDTPWNAGGGDPLKLFHPASQRYYVVTACLICRTLGMPDHPVDSGAQERVSFVMRMVRDNDELAFVHGAWQPVSGNALAPGEEQIPMSPLTYVEDDGRRRRMYNGVIPVARREAYLGATAPQPGNATPPPDPREIALQLKVLGPWAALEDVADGPFNGTENVGVGNPASADVGPANAQIRISSWFILIDLDRWLEENLNQVWRAVHGLGTPTDPKQFKALVDLAEIADDEGVSLISSLQRARGHAGEIESQNPPYPDRADWPQFKFVVARPSAPVNRQAGKDARTAFKSQLMAPLAGTPVPAGVPVPAIGRISISVQLSPSFTVRCVYERPNCATKPPIVSEPTAVFQLASFFDPDAPARPIRVEMPADTTPAGLRKFDKNTSFVMSDILCGQVSALRRLSFGDLVRSVLPWPFHKDLGVSPGSIGPCTDGGMVCSLSIPIITICALVLLMMIVKLLDLAFFWMPFFQICLPTNFKAKG